jgi:cytidylate kinase
MVKNQNETDELSVEKFVNQQIKKWEKIYSVEEKKERADIPVITLCMEPGSSGCLIAEQVSNRLGFDFFHRDMIHKISESARISKAVVESLERERMSGLQDFIASVIKDKYIHPSTYLNHLMKVVGTIGRHGHAVIVGRGANFIIPPQDRFAVRVIAPLEFRVENVANRFGVSKDSAKRRVMVRESRRRAFVRQSFNADINDPLNYNLILNTGAMKIEVAVATIIVSVMGEFHPGKRAL